MKRWMFFLPNDGTHGYPSQSDCDNTVLWERISDLENHVETLRNRNDELNRIVDRYQGVVNPNTVRVESVFNEEIPVQFMKSDNERKITQYLSENNVFVHEMYQNYQNEVVMRTSLKIAVDNLE